MVEQDPRLVNNKDIAKKIADPHTDELLNDVELSKLHQAIGVQDQFGNAMDYAKGNIPTTADGLHIDYVQLQKKQKKLDEETLKKEMAKQEKSLSEEVSKPNKERKVTTHMAAIADAPHANEIADEKINNTKQPVNNKKDDFSDEKAEVHVLKKNNSPKKKNNTNNSKKNNSSNNNNRKKKNRNNNNNPKSVRVKKESRAKNINEISKEQKEQANRLVHPTKPFSDNTTKSYPVDKDEKELKEKNKDLEGLVYIKSRDTVFPNDEEINENASQQKSPKEGYHYEQGMLVPDFDQEKATQNAILLDKLSVGDLDSIEFIDGDKNNKVESAVDTNFNLIESSRPVTEVTLLESGYTAFFGSLSFSELGVIMGSQEDDYAHTYQLYQIYYKNLDAINLGGKTSFEEFLDITTVNDLPTIQYALYCSTFPEAGHFDFQCGNEKCGKQIKNFPIDNSDLVTINEDETFKRRRDIISHIHDRNSLKKYSLVPYVKRIVLPKSKVIVDVQVTTLKDYLNILGALKADRRQNIDRQAFNLLMYTRQIAFPDIENYKKTGKLSYIKTSKYNKIYSFFKKINLDDFAELTSAILSYSTKYSIQYGIREATCPYCGYINRNIGIDFEDLLFSHTLQSLQNSSIAKDI